MSSSKINFVNQSTDTPISLWGAEMYFCSLQSVRMDGVRHESLTGELYLVHNSCCSFSKHTQTLCSYLCIDLVLISRIPSHTPAHSHFLQFCYQGGTPVGFIHYLSWIVFLKDVKWRHLGHVSRVKWHCFAAETVFFDKSHHLELPDYVVVLSEL